PPHGPLLDRLRLAAGGDAHAPPPRRRLHLPRWPQRKRAVRGHVRSDQSHRQLESGHCAVGAAGKETAMRLSTHITAAAALAAACAANAQSMPPMGGPMRHIMVERIGDGLHVHVEAGEPPMLQNYGETYTAPADVLDGKWFNAQYGWMAEGFWEPPAGASVWFELVEQTPGLESYRAMTFAPIFTTEASSPRLRWDGRMMHNWYAVTAPGACEATY